MIGHEKMMPRIVLKSSLRGRGGAAQGRHDDGQQESEEFDAEPRGAVMRAGGVSG